MRSRKKRKVVVYTTSTSDTSDVGVVAQREVDQCVSILVQTTSTFFFVCYNLKKKSIDGVEEQT